MMDRRNYYATIEFNQEGYLPNKWKFLIDTNFIDSKQFDTSLILVKSSERALGGVYRFQVFDSMQMQGIRKIHGEYSASGDMSGHWHSEKDGYVTIDTLWKGTTDLNSDPSRSYFENKH